MRLLRKMLHRPTRRGFLIAVLYMLFITAFAWKHESILSQLKSPQERYEEEAAKQPSVFNRFVTTVNRLRPSKDVKTLKLQDDPRLAGKSGIQVPKIYRPYPDYESPEWKQSHRAPFQPCEGPRGKLLTESLEDQVGAYPGVPEGFPKPIYGSYESTGLEGDISFDRYTRYGAYGFGENERSVENWIKPSKVEWDNVNWGGLQEQCYQRNADRFSQDGKTANFPFKSSSGSRNAESRTAVLIRTYIGKDYSENDKYVLRSMITELSLQTGGEYEIILLMQVKDPDIPIELEDVYQEVVQTNVPQEFWNITLLWNVPMVAARYPELDQGAIDVHHAQWLSLQNFALEHPEFEHIWNWEVDARYTGHHYDFVTSITNFATNQPRRGMWERNSRFYIPGVHGDYDTTFRAFVQQIESEAVWGPAPLDDRELPRVSPSGPMPPFRLPEQDKDYSWGVGEEADYIGFLPIFHPIGTDWVIRNEVFGYLGPDTPRRASLITHSRVSRRLLLAMDSENLQGRHMGSEMFPTSTALLHGLKAIYAPHPVFSDKGFPPKSVDKWFNTGVNGRTGSTENSPFGWGRETRFKDLSWYYRCNLPGRLYWNFLGWEKEGTGGKSYESQNGRVVLPPILFHPVKDVYPEADSTSYIFDSELGVQANPGQYG